MTSQIVGVAPYVGAWIETRGRATCYPRETSHPMWVRGLKRFLNPHSMMLRKVAPYVGAWIETSRSEYNSLT